MSGESVRAGRRSFGDETLAPGVFEEGDPNGPDFRVRVVGASGAWELGDDWFGIPPELRARVRAAADPAAELEAVFVEEGGRRVIIEGGDVAAWTQMSESDRAMVEASDDPLAAFQSVIARMRE